MAIVNGYTTLAEWKARHARGVVTNAANDAALEAVIESAAREIDQACQRHFWSTDDADGVRLFGHADLVPGHGATRLRVSDIVPGQITSVEVDTNNDGTHDRELVDGVDFEAVARFVNGIEFPVTELRMLTGAWPDHGRYTRVKVTAQFGWPSVPHQVKAANLALASLRWQSSDAPLGIVSGDFGVIRLRDVDYIWQMLGPFRADPAELFVR